MDADTQRRRDARVAYLCSLLATLELDQLDAVEPVVLELARERHTWAKHESPQETRWHAVAGYEPASVVTRCKGRWSRTDAYETAARPPIADRCPACQELHVGARISAIAKGAITHETEHRDQRGEVEG